ncbi:MAG: endolytic transglycosylase MltG [Bifidobacteriaceae bacterium]|nr:endolytic transglycosylase MltG [Bifidobacteriaceae bacterium]
MTEWFTDPQWQSVPPSRHSVEAEAQKAKGARRRRYLVTAGVSLVTLLGLGGALVFVVVPFLEDMRGQPTEEITDYTGPGEGSVTVVVNPGDGGVAIGETLAEAGVVATASAFADAFSANPRAQSIQPGTYTLAGEMRAADAVTALLDPTKRQVVKFTVPEGFRADQVYQRIAEATGLSVESLRATARDVEGIGLPPEAEGDPEGWLFPATYELDPNATAVQALAPMVAKTIEVLEGFGAEPEVWRDTIILASMIEKEAKLDEDRPKVARVFLNRLDQEMPLGSDATVAYGAGDFSSVFSSDEALADENPYNTYVNQGLPAGPICNPGEAAIAAALSPAEGDWLYFVTVNLETGETAYAETAAGHEANVQLMNEWIAKNPGDY